MESNTCLMHPLSSWDAVLCKARSSQFMITNFPSCVVWFFLFFFPSVKELFCLFCKFKFTFFFNWRILFLQCYVGFAMQQRESALSMQMSAPQKLAAAPYPIPRLLVVRALGWAPCAPRRFSLAVCLTHGGVHTSVPLSRFVLSPLSSPCPQVCSLYGC